MTRRGEVLALVQAGGQGGRMDVLTRERAKPALPYGGVHQLVDFALSALVHAGIDDVWVSLEYQVTSIDDYLSGGRPVEPGPQPGRLPADGPADRHRPRDRERLRARQRRPAAAHVGRPRDLRRADPGGLQRRPRLQHGPRAGHRGARRRRPRGHRADHRGDQEGRRGQRRGASPTPTGRSPGSSTSRRGRPPARSRPRSSSTTPRSCCGPCASCGPSWRATRRATTAGSATSASTSCPAWSRPARRWPSR